MQPLVVLVAAAAVCGGGLAQQATPVHDPPTPGMEAIHSGDQSEVVSAISGRTWAWAAAAYDLLQSVPCEAEVWASRSACEAAQGVPRAQTQVWATEAGQGRFVARLPDSALSRSGSHPGVLLLDPFPEASWGHLVLIIFVASNTSRHHCSLTQGVWTQGDCLRVAVKDHCHNVLERRGQQRDHRRRCETHLPPLVVREDEAPSPGPGPRLPRRPTQQLRCRDAPGYAACTPLRPLNQTASLVCDPLGVNRQRCKEHEGRGMAGLVHTRCRLFEVCDQGVVVSGGWSRDLTPPATARTVDAAYRMLRHNGFLKANIKLFYANGAQKDHYPAVGQSVYPSWVKASLRHHLRSLCSSPLCTDSLLLYLTGPALPDGSLLLWDEDRDGLVGAGEVYSPRELLGDLQHCQARQVTVLADISYAGELVSAFAASNNHNNVQVFGAGEWQQYSWGREFSAHWLHYAHAHACTHHVFQTSRSSVRRSQPTSYDGSHGRLRRTIFGAPCDVRPPYTWRELHRRYLGCQNTPTALWLRAHPHPHPFSSPRIID